MREMAGFLLLVLTSSVFATCPAGTIYESSYNKCYKYSASPLNFLSAEKACNSIGGSLVAVQNAFENTYIIGIAAASSASSSLWIGSNLLMANYWSWTSGYNGTYSNFAPGQPSDPSIYQCAAVRDVDNAWMKELCSTQKPYMCQIDPNVSPVGNGCSTLSYTSTAYPMTTSTSSYPVTATTTRTTAVPPGCPNGYCTPGYVLNPDACKCYKIVSGSDVIIRSQAFTSCQAEDAILPIIRNAAENDWISSFIISRTIGSQLPWIGLLCNSSSTDSCKWDDGSALGYSNFAPGNPKNEGYDWSDDGPAVFLNERQNMLWFSFADIGFTFSLLCEKPGLQNRAAEDFRANSTFTKKKSGYSTADRKMQ